MSALRSLRTVRTTRLPAARAFSTRTAAPAVSIAARLQQRGITTSSPVNVNPSQPVADGGPEDIAHHGINVDAPVRMDT